MSTNPYTIVSRLGLREEIVKRTGRYDLVGTQTVEDDTTPDYSVDNGIDNYIHEARMFLCDKLPWLISRRAINITLPSGSWKYAVENLRTIEALKVQDPATRAYSNVTAKSYREIMDINGAPIATMTPGTPQYWDWMSYSVEDVTSTTEVYTADFSEGLDGWTDGTSEETMTAAGGHLIITGWTGKSYGLGRSLVIAEGSFLRASMKFTCSVDLSSLSPLISVYDSNGRAFAMTAEVQSPTELEAYLNLETATNILGQELTMPIIALSVTFIKPDDYDDELSATIDIESFSMELDSDVAIPGDAPLIFDRPADQDYVLELLGTFYPDIYGANTSRDWLSVTRHDLIIDAACYVIAEAYGDEAQAQQRLMSLTRKLDGPKKSELQQRMARMQNSAGVINLGG